jgi:hypothetical protein
MPLFAGTRYAPSAVFQTESALQRPLHKGQTGEERWSSLSMWREVKIVRGTGGSSLSRWKDTRRKLTKGLKAYNEGLIRAAAPTYFYECMRRINLVMPSPRIVEDIATLPIYSSCFIFHFSISCARFTLGSFDWDDRCLFFFFFFWNASTLYTGSPIVFLRQFCVRPETNSVFPWN